MSNGAFHGILPLSHRRDTFTETPFSTPAGDALLLRRKWFLLRRSRVRATVS
jgi:hypothetical protein